MQTKVSIIIPVYNSKAYLRKCFDSCVSQTLEGVEIIAVDDCSTDGSRDIILEYAGKYDNFRYIFQPENGRQGKARNAGIAAARGEYLLFVDSDDYIEPDACEALYKAADGADMCGGDYYITSIDSEKKIKLQYTRDDVGVMTSEKKDKLTRTCGMFWARLYKKSFLDEFDIRFPEKLLYEDAYFNFMTILYSRTTARLDYYFYYYYQSPDSTVRSRNKPHQYDRLTITDMICDECVKRGLFDKYTETVICKFLNMSASNVLHTCLSLFDEPDAAKLLQIGNSVKKRVPDYKTYIGVITDREAAYYLKLCIISPEKCIKKFKSNAYSKYYLFDALRNKLKL